MAGAAAAGGCDGVAGPSGHGSAGCTKVYSVAYVGVAKLKWYADVPDPADTAVGDKVSG